jgi:hypothetical protein
MKTHFILIPLALLAVTACKRESSTPPPAAKNVTTKTQAESILYNLVKDHPDFPSCTFRTGATDSPAFTAEIKGEWHDAAAGPHGTAHYVINAFFKDGTWYYDPTGSTAKFLGVAEPESTRIGSTYLNTIADTLNLAE